MKGYVINIEKATSKNTDFRRVVYTAKNSQLVLMSLRPGEAQFSFGSEFPAADVILIRMARFLGQSETLMAFLSSMS